MKYYLKGEHLLGDSLMLTPLIRELDTAGHEVHFLHPKTKPGWQLLQGNPYLAYFYYEDKEQEWTELDAMEAFQWAAPRGKLLSQGFAARLGVELTSFHYDYVLSNWGREWGMELAREYGKDFVIVARHSSSCASNDPAIRVPNKCIANRTWVQVAQWLLTQGITPVAVGAAEEESDSRYREWPGPRLYGRSIDEVAGLLPHARAVLSVDTGIRHLAAAVGANLYCCSGIIPLSLIRCFPVQKDQRIHEEHIPLPYVTPRRLIEGIQQVL